MVTMEDLIMANQQLLTKAGKVINVIEEGSKYECEGIILSRISSTPSTLFEIVQAKARDYTNLYEEAPGEDDGVPVDKEVCIEWAKEVHAAIPETLRDIYEGTSTDELQCVLTGCWNYFDEWIKTALQVGRAIRRDGANNPNPGKPQVGGQVGQTPATTQKAKTTSTEFTGNLFPEEIESNIREKILNDAKTKIQITEQAAIVALCARRDSLGDIFPDGVKFVPKMKVDEIKTKFDSWGDRLVDISTSYNEKEFTSEQNMANFQALKDAVVNNKPVDAYLPKDVYKYEGFCYTYPNIVEGTSDGNTKAYVANDGIDALLNDFFVGKIPTGESGIGIEAQSPRQIKKTDRQGVETKTVRFKHKWVGKKLALEDKANKLIIISKQKDEGTEEERMQKYTLKTDLFFLVWKLNPDNAAELAKDDKGNKIKQVIRLSGTVDGPAYVLKEEFSDEAVFKEIEDKAVIASAVSEEYLKKFVENKLRAVEGAAAGILTEGLSDNLMALANTVKELANSASKNAAESLADEE